MITLDPTSCVTIHPQTDFVVMSMSGGGGGRDMRMDSTLPTVDADGKESADNDTNGDHAGPPNNVITRSNGNTGPQLPTRSRRLSHFSPTAPDSVAGASIHVQPPPVVLDTLADRGSIDETPISPTSTRAPQADRGRPRVRLPPQVPTETDTNDRPNTVSPTSIQAPQVEEPLGRPLVRLPPQMPAEVNTNDRYDTVVISESPISPSTLNPAQALPSSTQDHDEITTEAANTLLMLADDNLNSRPQESPLLPDLQHQGISSRDFATDPVPVDRSSISPPNEPFLDQQARSITSSDSGTSMLRMPRPARFLFPSDSSSVASSPVSQPANPNSMLHMPQPARFLSFSDFSSFAPSPVRQPVDANRQFRHTQDARFGGLHAHVPSPHGQSLVHGQGPVRTQPSRRGQALAREHVSPRGQAAAHEQASRHGQAHPRRQAPVQRQVVESTATSLASTPEPQMTAVQQPSAMRQRIDALRRDQVYLEQRIRIKFAPPTPSTVRIQHQFASMQHAMQRDRRLSLQFQEMDPARYKPLRSRRQQVAELEGQSRNLECRLRLTFENLPRDVRDRQEQEQSYNHARRLNRRLSAEFPEIDPPADTPGCLEGRSEASSMPSSAAMLEGSGAQSPSYRQLVNGERSPMIRRRSESSSPVVVDWGRTRVSVIVDGRTSAQRRRSPLPDVREWYPAVNGNPAGPRPRSLTEGEESLNLRPEPPASDGNDDALSVPRSPIEGEAGPSTWAQAGNQHRSESAPPTSISPMEAEVGASGRAQPGPNNQGDSASHSSHSPNEGKAGPSSRSQRQPPREPTPTVPESGPWNPFHGGAGITLLRRGTGLMRIVMPVAAYVPGDTNLPVPPPATALRDRRLDQHHRIFELNSSDGEGSERVIASPSSQGSDGEGNLDADDEDSERDPVVAMKEE